VIHEGPNDDAALLRAPRDLLNAARRAAEFHGRTFNDELKLHVAIGCTLSALIAALEAPGETPGAAETRELAEGALPNLARVAFGRPLPDELLASLLHPEANVN
jgi:hypothetical protein